MFCFSSSRNSIPDSLSIVELSVYMDCDACEKEIRKTIDKLDGVDSVVIDMDTQKVTVTGYFDQSSVLKAVRRTGRKAEFWPYYPFALQYLEDATYMTNYNYYHHGYTSNVHGYFPDPAFSEIVDDNAVAMFNDDNVHACSIM